MRQRDPEALVNWWIELVATLDVSDMTQQLKAMAWVVRVLISNGRGVIAANGLVGVLVTRRLQRKSIRSFTSPAESVRLGDPETFHTVVVHLWRINSRSCIHQRDTEGFVKGWIKRLHPHVHVAWTKLLLTICMFVWKTMAQVAHRSLDHSSGTLCGRLTPHGTSVFLP